MRLKTRAEIEAEEAAKIRSKKRQWDTSKLAIIYIRQSREVQTRRNRESRGGQSVDLVDMAVREYQWPERNIYPIDENLLDKFGNQLDKPRNASGRLDTTFRAGLRTAEELIAQDLVGAVFVQNIARLFRDPEQINPPQFAALCKQHHCVVITPDAEYDFNSKYDDYDDFLEEARDAAGYLKTLAKTMHRGKHRKGERGEYSGGAIATGFMLDEERRHFVPMPEWCDVVKWLTRRYRELDADLAALFSEIRGKPIFPPLPDDFDISRIGRVQLRPVPGGYTIAARRSLIDLLTNVVNIGHAVYRGKIVKYDAHPAIVDREDFQFAIEHLGSTDLDGEEIQREKREVRFPQEGTKREGLLSGLRSNGKSVVTSPQGNVHVHQTEEHIWYVIRNTRTLRSSQRVSSIPLDIVDAELEKRLAEKLRELNINAEVERELNGSPEHGAQAVLNHVERLKQKISLSLKSVDATLKDIEREIAKRERDYRIASDVMSNEDIREHFASLKRLRERHADISEKKKLDKKIAADVETVQKRLETARTQWEDFDMEQKRSFLRLITTSIQMEVLSPRFMRLTVEWSYLLTGEYTTEFGLFWREMGTTSKWAAQEDEALRTLYPLAAKRDVLEALPHRNWQTIKLRASIKEIRRKTREHGLENGVTDILSQDDMGVIAPYGIELGWIEQGLVACWYREEVIKQEGEWLHAPLTSIFRSDDKNYEVCYRIFNTKVGGKIPQLLFCLT